MNIQYKKGVLNSAVAAQKRVAMDMKYLNICQTINIADGTVYPILRKLKVKDWCLFICRRRGGPSASIIRSLTLSGNL